MACKRLHVKKRTTAPPLERSVAAGVPETSLDRAVTPRVGRG